MLAVIPIGKECGISGRRQVGTILATIGQVNLNRHGHAGSDDTTDVFGARLHLHWLFKLEYFE